jgi:hypothetical protein
MSVKQYGLSGVGTNIELGKNGFQIQYDSVNGWIEILQSDGSTLGTLQVAEPSANSDVSTKLYVDTQVNNLIDSAPGTLDTLNEIAAALNDDPDFYTTITGLINDKADSSTVTEIDANVDDLITLSGVAENSTDLGTFTGSVITDNSTVKEALQDLETEIDQINADTSGHVHATLTKDSTSPADIGSTDIPSGSTVEKVVVNVTEAWGAGATMEIGHSGDTDLWATSSEIDLTEVGQYVITPLYGLTAADYRAIATMNHNASGTGSAFVFVKYC